MKDLRQENTNTYQLGEKEMQAVELKYKGERYDDIAQVVGVKRQTIKEWFSSKGRLNREYISFEKEQNLILKENAGQTLKREVDAAAKIVVRLLDDKNPSISLRAAVFILERELGKTARKDISEKMTYVDFIESIVQENAVIKTN